MFRIDLEALVITAIVLVGFFYFWRRKQAEILPHFLYSRISNFPREIEGKRVRYHHYEKLLFLLAFTFLLVAFLDPRFMTTIGDKKAKPLYTEGVAIYFILDISGSMDARVLDLREEKVDTFPTRLELLKNVTKQFIEKRPQDLIGLVSFARGAWVLAPLTLDHELLLQKLQKLEVVKDRDYDGTAIGYAIYKTASIIAATKQFGKKEGSYDIKGSALILVTDGFQGPNPKDKGKRLRTIGIEEAAAYAKNQGARLYIINIDPIIKDPEFAPQRRLMERAAEETGGKFFAAADSKKLEGIYHSINQLEESKLAVFPKETMVRSASFYPLFIWLGLIALLAGIVLETLIIKRVP